MTKLGKVVEELQEVVYDNLPLYCNHYKHQEHDELKCRVLLGKKVVEQKEIVDVYEKEGRVVEKLQGDARAYLNKKQLAKVIAPGTQTLAVASTSGKEVAKDGSKQLITGVNEAICDDPGIQEVNDGVEETEGDKRNDNHELGQQVEDSSSEKSHQEPLGKEKHTGISIQQSNDNEGKKVTGSMVALVANELDKDWENEGEGDWNVVTPRKATG